MWGFIAAPTLLREKRCKVVVRLGKAKGHRAASCMARPAAIAPDREGWRLSARKVQTGRAMQRHLPCDRE
jgi:hypothetical protein